MNPNFVSFLAEAAAAPQQEGGMNMMVMLPIFALMMYFMIIRPQRRQQKEQQERIARLASGDKVITAGGIHGMITNVKEKTVIVRIAENVRVEVEKSSVSIVTQKADEPETPEVVK